MNTGTPHEPYRRAAIIINPNGLHMRPATTFAQLAAGVASDIIVWHGEKRANGKSLWDLIGLCALRGTELIVEADGPDAEVVVGQLVAILASPGDPD
ncbi:HPr family phosphocarrier protein [Limnoglobus roseus]|uniref:Phosphocarrier protein HPr n=1 Tax=Limnoglobus roseus TaxID=2598579 RepID=A0A5C1A9K6_9BACT|nr:HPr family phosphocarrier protein [Limnoglobus roseus]QEL14883.1 histidine-containing phosphocarrier protein HPr of PTS system [Limnoglobus roseus]